MVKIDTDLLDQIAELEVLAILEGLQNPEMRRNPAFLDKVRKFMKDNHLQTTPETPGVSNVQKEAIKLPVFDTEVTLN